jgi:hypothetical protein
VQPVSSTTGAEPFRSMEGAGGCSSLEGCGALSNLKYREHRQSMECGGVLEVATICKFGGDENLGVWRALASAGI